jgi:hypothetical protein
VNLLTPSIIQREVAFLLNLRSVADVDVNLETLRPNVLRITMVVPRGLTSFECSIDDLGIALETFGERFIKPALAVLQPRPAGGPPWDDVH